MNFLRIFSGENINKLKIKENKIANPLIEKKYKLEEKKRK